MLLTVLVCSYAFIGILFLPVLAGGLLAALHSQQEPRPNDGVIIGAVSVVGATLWPLMIVIGCINALRGNK